jgi:hypothetical protein
VDPRFETGIWYCLKESNRPHQLLRSADHERLHIKQVQKPKLPLNIEY